ncbi:MAG: hypothetical protein HPY83_06545 [Anaerolineae bacterium]|nr:hypothetical protein [Anaerolineae bacterium]
MSELNRLRFGQPEAPAAWRPFRAGPLSLYFDPTSGDIRHLRLGDREVLRRVYVAVRDRHWGTILPTVTGMHVEEGESMFSLRFLAVHHRDDITFAWAGEVSGDNNGRVTYSMAGHARASFLSNRTGICVLHPAHECAGLPCTVQHTDGSIEEGHFPLYIAPHQPFKDIRRLTYPISQDLRASVAFEGDVFEMEDQRNWTDASFKTYSTPLDQPIPKIIPAGVQVAQSVTLTLEGPTLERESPPSRRYFSTPSPPRLTCTVGAEPLGPLPRVGLGIAPDPEAHGGPQRSRLKFLRPSYLRWELDLGREWEEDLWHAAGLAQSAGAPLELAIFPGPEPEDQVAGLAEVLPSLSAPVDHLLLYDEDDLRTSLEDIRDRLSRALPKAKLGGGTYRYFTELNRARPSLSWAHLACYSLNPQVHAFDHASLVETLPMHAWTVSCARRLYPGTPIAVSPITLTPRPRPTQDGDAPPRPGADPRQTSLFTAAWTVGSLKYLTQAGVRSVTYYETAGPAGVMASGEPGPVYPVYHVLADVLEHPEALVLPTFSGDPLRVEALALRWSHCARVLVANLTLQPLEVGISGLGQAAWVRHLDETTAEQALSRPEEWRQAPWAERAAPGGALTLSLLPCAVATVDTW